MRSDVYVPDQLQKNVIHQITFRNSEYPKTSTTSKQQHPCLTYSPAKVLDEWQTAQTCRDFHCAKDELCEVDIQTKITNIQAQSIVHQTYCKPIELERYFQHSHIDIGVVNNNNIKY